MKVIEYSNRAKLKKLILGKKIVLVGGCFDILHYGHIKFLKNAKKLGDFLIVILESDKFIIKKKKKKPFHNMSKRIEILSSISFVNLIIKIPFFKNNEQYFQLVEFIKPKVIAVSDKDPYFNQKKEQIEKIGGKIKVVCPVIKKFSSTKAIPYATISCD